VIYHINIPTRATLASASMLVDLGLEGLVEPVAAKLAAARHLRLSASAEAV
jgi:hypothetical protein